MDNLTRTIYSSYLATVLNLGLTYEMIEKSTLNEKFGVQSGISPAPGVIPSIGYFGIGNGGHKLSVGANGYTKSEAVQHRARDAALYNHIPFILRELTDDIDVTERIKYGMRRKETYNSTQYIAYYLRRLDFTNVITTNEYITVNSGVETVTDFTPNTSDLNPTPPDLTSTGTNVVTGDYLKSSAKINLEFTETDIAELLNVFNIIYGDNSYAIISEICLVSGVDKVVQSFAANNAVINFNEVIAAQVATYVNTLYPLSYINTGFNIALDVGICESLLKIN